VGLDLIDVSGWGVATLGALTISQGTGYVRIRADDFFDARMDLTGIMVGELDASDFIFA